MVHEFNLRQKAANPTGQGDPGPPPTDAERAAWRESLRRGALPDERIPG